MLLARLKWITFLSLDAPLVAVAWQALLAKAGNVSLQWYHALIVFLSVWLGYAADRYFDSRSKKSAGSEQHALYRKHAKAVLATWILVLATAVSFALAELTQHELARGLVLMSASIAYTAFAQGGRALPLYPLAKSAFTSSLILASSLLFLPIAALPLATLLAAWSLFLCNCLLIRSWSCPQNQFAHRIAIVAAVATAVSSVSVIWAHQLTLAAAPLLSLSLLAALHLNRSRLPLIVRRTLADLCLLTPLPLLWL